MMEQKEGATEGRGETERLANAHVCLATSVIDLLGIMQYLHLEKKKKKSRGCTDQ